MSTYSRDAGLVVSIMLALTHYLYPVPSSLAIHGICGVMLDLTMYIFPVCHLVSYANVTHSRMTYHWLLISLQAILVYLFHTGDLIGYYVAFEMALLPLYVLIGGYGASTNRLRASRLL